MIANTLSFGETSLKVVKFIGQSMLFSVAIFSNTAQAFESALESEIHQLEIAHSAQIENCAGMAKKVGPITLDLSKLNTPDFNKTILQTALGRISQANLEACSQETRLPLVEALVTFRMRVAAQHPFKSKVENLLDLLLPTPNDLEMRVQYEGLPETYKTELENQLNGKLFSVRQIENFAEIRAALK